jgi:uncharacterized protein (TIGR03437 family)
MSASKVCKSRWIQTILVCLIGATPGFPQTTTYTITTFAGNGNAANVGNGMPGFSGDGGPANASQLSSPFALAVDGSGNLYIVDNGNQRIRKVVSGTINTVAGNGTAGYFGDGGAATLAEINNPQGIAVDSSNNYYIADTSNSLIRKVSSSGTITTIAGNNITGPGYVDAPVATNGQLSLPVGIAVDSSGNIYISESDAPGVVNGNNRIRKVTAGGVLTTIGGNGVIGSSGDGGPATAAHLSNPLGLAVDKVGNVYIADSGNNKIRKISAVNGIITTVAGTGIGAFSGDGGPAINAQLNNPTGVALDAAGNIYIADNRNFRIRMVSANGNITTIAGKAASGYSGDGGPATSASLKFPTGVSVDSSGNVYVADNQNSVIRLLTPNAPVGGSGVPAIGSGGVVSAGSFGGFSSIAPGSWIEIYGTNLAADTDTWDNFFTGINAPTSIDRTSLTVGGQSAFIDYISPGQVNAQVPSNVVPGTQPIIVTTAGGASAVYNITVNTTQPGMLAPPSFVVGGKQYVVAQHSDGTYVLPANAIAGLTSTPAKPGETIVIYGVGFGPVIVAGGGNIPAGQIVQFNNSLALPFQVSIGGAVAALGYDGLAQTNIGLYQFNVVVPTIPDNNAAPLTFTLGGTSGSQTLFTAVKN